MARSRPISASGHDRRASALGAAASATRRTRARTHMHHRASLAALPRGVLIVAVVGQSFWPVRCHLDSPSRVVTATPWTTVVPSSSRHITCMFLYAASSCRAHSARRRATPPRAAALPGVRVPQEATQCPAGLALCRMWSCRLLALS